VENGTRYKSHIRKRYPKIHVAVDIKRERILSLEVTSEKEHDDGMMLSKLVDEASSSGGNHVKGVLADGMYDSNKNFRYLSRNHIKPGIKTRRSNSKVRKFPNMIKEIFINATLYNMFN
jgi:Transposase DDE domain